MVSDYQGGITSTVLSVEAIPWKVTTKLELVQQLCLWKSPMESKGRAEEDPLTCIPCTTAINKDRTTSDYNKFEGMAKATYPPVVPLEKNALAD